MLLNPSTNQQTRRPRASTKSSSSRQRNRHSRPNRNHHQFQQAAQYCIVMLVSSSQSLASTSGMTVFNFSMIQCFFRDCKLPKSKRPKVSNSRTNQARFDSKVVDGSVCQMKCAKYPKPPFKAPKMSCVCGSNARFNHFSNLQSLLQNGPNVTQLLFKSCHWYNLQKKTSTPVMPINGK